MKRLERYAGAALGAALALSIGTGALADWRVGEAKAVRRDAAIVVAQGGSCSAWKSTCESRGGGANCESKYRACLKSGCFTEGAKFGGATHCSLAKQ